MSFEKPIETAIKHPKNFVTVAAAAFLFLVLMVAFLYHLLGAQQVHQLIRRSSESRQSNDVGPVTGGPGSQNSGVNTGTMINGAKP